MQRLAPLISILALASLTSTPAQAQWTQDNLSLARQTVAAVHVSGKALFATGRAGNTLYGRVDILDTANDTWTQATRTARTAVGATAVGNFALFAGGGLSPTVLTSLVDIYDGQTGLWSQTTLSMARSTPGAGTLGTMAFFAGGYSLTTGLDNIDIYDSSLGNPTNPAAWSTYTLTVPRGGVAVATVGSRILFAGGLSGTQAAPIVSDRVDIYDSSLGAPTDPAAWSTASLSQARLLEHGGIGAGTHAFFAGGQIAQGVMSDVIDIYDAQTGIWSTQSLSSPRSLLGLLAVDQRVLFAGGALNGFVPSATVEVYDELNGGWLPPMALSLARFDMGATAAGNVLYFAGGNTGGGPTSTRVDVYDGLAPTPFCSGDGSAGACPCANYGTTGRGCDNSAATGGALLEATGTPSIANDTLVFGASGELPTVLTIFLQGSAHVSPLAFGDGLRCAGGMLKCLYAHNALNGAVSAPLAGEPSVSARSAQLGDTLGAGSVRYYQAYYRDPVLGFCASGSSFNSSSALMVIWAQ